MWSSGLVPVTGPRRETAGDHCMIRVFAVEPRGNQPATVPKGTSSLKLLETAASEIFSPSEVNQMNEGCEGKQSALSLARAPSLALSPAS